MKTIADYQPSDAIRALIRYAAGLAPEHDLGSVVARGALCTAVYAELTSQDIWLHLPESDAWCDAAIADYLTKTEA